MEKALHIALPWLSILHLTLPFFSPTVRNVTYASMFNRLRQIWLKRFPLPSEERVKSCVPGRKGNRVARDQALNLIFGPTWSAHCRMTKRISRTVNSLCSINCTNLLSRLIRLGSLFTLTGSFFPSTSAGAAGGACRGKLQFSLGCDNRN